MRTQALAHLQTTKTRISLHICTVWSGPLLSNNRIINYCIVHVDKHQRLCGWLGGSGALLLTRGKMTLPYVTIQNCCCIILYELQLDEFWFTFIDFYHDLLSVPRKSLLSLSNLCQVRKIISLFGCYVVILHYYENMSIQMYLKFYNQKRKKKSDKKFRYFFIFLLKT